MYQRDRWTDGHRMTAKAALDASITWQQYCSTEAVLLIFPFIQTNITSQMWPNGNKVW